MRFVVCLVLPLRFRTISDITSIKARIPGAAIPSSLVIKIKGFFFHHLGFKRDSLFFVRQM
jgi:hypothetical protein